MTNNFPIKPRLKWAQTIARSILIYNGVDCFPVNVFALLKSINRVDIKKYSARAAAVNKTIEEYANTVCSTDGFTAYIKEIDTYLVMYNDTCKSQRRILWTLAHELGHIMLNHHKDYDKTILSRDDLTYEEYMLLDTEADAFAAELLSPTILAAASGWYSVEDLIAHNGLSKEAAKYRSKNLRRVIPAIRHAFRYEEKLLKNFYNHMYMNFCPECKTFFVSKEAEYCPICGSHSIIWKEGEENIMKYPGIELDDNLKAKVCPKCDNEEIVQDGDFCKICGIDLTNKCTDKHPEIDCGKKLPGNARFCPYCGSPSSFFIAGVLPDWEMEKQLAETQPLQHPIFEEIPF